MKIDNTIRVILADDHAVIRHNIRKVLEKASNICVIGEASTGTDTLRLMHELRPDVLVLDLEMPDMNGVQVARALLAAQSPASIVILSACEEENFIAAVLQMGVYGYVKKSEPPAKLLEMISQLPKKHTVPLTLFFLAVLPKLGWMLLQAIPSLNPLPADINFL